MGLDERLKRLEQRAGVRDFAYDLTLLTDAELLALEACTSEAEASGDGVRLTPELESALNRVKR
jgi:hypothetical protein